MHEGMQMSGRCKQRVPGRKSAKISFLAMEYQLPVLRFSCIITDRHCSGSAANRCRMFSTENLITTSLQLHKIMQIAILCQMYKSFAWSDTIASKS